jgi:hypothetical protein
MSFEIKIKSSLERGTRNLNLRQRSTLKNVQKSWYKHVNLKLI